MKRILVLACLVLALGLSACGAPRPASIKETGRKPVNDVKYYPQLTESQRKKFSRDKSVNSASANQKNSTGKIAHTFDNDSM